MESHQERLEGNLNYLDSYYHDPDPYAMTEEVMDKTVGALGILIHCSDMYLL